MVNEIRTVVAWVVVVFNSGNDGKEREKPYGDETVVYFDRSMGDTGVCNF